MIRFGQRLAAAMDRYGPLCVGIDPHPSLLTAWGLADDAEGLRAFSLRMVEAAAGRAAAVKPQSAFFERRGAAGVAVLEEVLAAARAADILSILDVKRGDIGSTMLGYAEAYLDPSSPLVADAVTLAPYLGFGSLTPALDLAMEYGKGVFVLALTSNPEGASIQLSRDAAGVSVAAQVATGARAYNQRILAAAAHCPDSGQPAFGVGGLMGSLTNTDHGDLDPSVPGAPADLGDIGLVIGATIGTAALRAGLDLGAVGGPLLAPGIGAQGAGEAELATVFGTARRAVLAASSRAISAHGPDLERLAAAIEKGAQELKWLRALAGSPNL